MLIGLAGKGLLDCAGFDYPVQARANLKDKVNVIYQGWLGSSLFLEAVADGSALRIFDFRIIVSIKCPGNFQHRIFSC